jgi:hypothetical protein
MKVKLIAFDYSITDHLFFSMIIYFLAFFDEPFISSSGTGVPFSYSCSSATEGGSERHEDSNITAP